MVYVNDGIFLGMDDNQLKQVIQEIQGTGLKIEDQGHPADYVGINIKKIRDGSYEFTQHALINAIIKDVISQMQRSSQHQPRCPCHSMHSRTLLPSI